MYHSIRVITSVVCPFSLRSFISQWDGPPSTSYTTASQSVVSSRPAPDPSLPYSTSYSLNTITGKDPLPPCHAPPCFLDKNFDHLMPAWVRSSHYSQTHFSTTGPPRQLLHPLPHSLTLQQASQLVLQGWGGNNSCY